MQNQTLKGFLISQQQRQTWILQHEQPVYRAQCALLLEGHLQRQRLQTALEGVVARHEILRTTFYRPAGMKVPVQVIAEQSLPDWRDIDLRTVPAEQLEATLNTLFQAAGSRPVDLAHGPLLQLALLVLAADKHVLLVSVPTLCADHWTLHNLMRELCALYAAGPQAEAALEEPFQYADFAAWQDEFLATEETQAATGRAYWRTQRPASWPVLRLPFERRPEAHASFAPETLTVQLQPGVTAGLEATARQYESTPAAFLLACWHTLLWRCTGEADVLVGQVCDGRHDPELHGAMGAFARWLPNVCHFDTTIAFKDVLWQVQDAMRQGAEWQEYCSWEDYLGTASESPASCGFEFVAWPGRQLTAGLSVSVSRQQCFLQRFKIQLTCAAAEGAITTLWHYDPACLLREHVERLACHFVTLVQSAVQYPEAPASALELLSAPERQQLIRTWNATTTEYPHQVCLQALFEAQVVRTPEAPAVVCGPQRLTYTELNSRANQLAHYLRQRGVGAGVPVGLCMERSVEMLVGLLGILKAGGAYVPLSPEHPRARLAQQIEELRAPVVLTLAAHAGHVPTLPDLLLCVDEDAARWAHEPLTNPPALTTPAHPAYVLYTSGSTGVPKGVVVSHRSIVNYTHFMCQRLKLQHRAGLHFALVSSLTADLGNTCLFPSLTSGGCLHLVPYEVVTDGTAFAHYVAQHPIDVLKIVPSHFQALLAAQADGAVILPRQYLILGGETLASELAQQIAALSGTCEVINHYGPTEATVGALTFRVSEAGAEPGLSATIPIGRPIANVEAYLFDQHWQPVPIGVPGELYLGGAGLAQGYLHQPERTAERFVPHPLAPVPGARLYKTGDLGRYLPDGSVEFLGRVDQQVKIRGYRIELGEIEAVLRRQAAVRQAVVLAREETPGHTRLVAYVVPQGPPAPSVSSLQQSLREALPEYMVPSALLLLETLPLTPNGKLDLRALPAPDHTEPEADKPYVAPHTPTEKLLADIWAQVLGRKHVSIHDNFFAELGGDSIMSIQIIARANQAGLRLVPKQMFEYQTIAALAAVASETTALQAQQGLVTGSLPLTPIQHWFFEQQFADPHHWNQTVMLEVRQALDPTLLEQVVQHLLAHHDGLRLRFQREASGWQQLNDALAEITPFTCIDLSTLPESAQRPALEAAAAALQASLHLSQGPLLRMAHIDLGGHTSSRLLMVMHHLLIDGVSWRIVLEDLQTGYEQLRRGERIKLPAKTTSFKAWAERLAVYAQSGALYHELDYWLAEPRQRVRRVLVDTPGGKNTVQSANTVRVWLPPEETSALLHDVPEAYHTQINDVLLTALVQAYARWTGTRSLLVDMEGHGREQFMDDVDPWRTVGWFTTHYPVLLDLGPATNPGDALKAIKEQLRAIPNRGIGYGVLRYLSGVRELAEQLQALPHAEVCFNYLGQFDQSLPDSSPFAVARESVGPSQSPRGHRSYLLYISGGVTEGCLQLTCLYSENLYQRATIETLMAGMAEALQEIIAHCQSPEAGDYTPSDFALAGLDQHKLRIISNLLEDIDASEEEVP